MRFYPHTLTVTSGGGQEGRATQARSLLPSTIFPQYRPENTWPRQADGSARGGPGQPKIWRKHWEIMRSGVGQFRPVQPTARLRNQGPSGRDSGPSAAASHDFAECATGGAIAVGTDRETRYSLWLCRHSWSPFGHGRVTTGRISGASAGMAPPENPHRDAKDGTSRHRAGGVTEILEVAPPRPLRRLPALAFDRSGPTRSPSGRRPSALR